MAAPAQLLCFLAMCLCQHYVAALPTAPPPNTLWETSCPTQANTFYSSLFRTSLSSFTLACKTHTDPATGSLSLLYSSQAIITSNSLPDHYYDTAIGGIAVSAQSAPKTPLSMTLPYQKAFTPYHLLTTPYQDPYRLSTLGGAGAVIGVALNGVPFTSSLSSPNEGPTLPSASTFERGRGFDSVVPNGGSEPLLHDECMGFVSADGTYSYKTAPPCLFLRTDNKGQGLGVGVLRPSPPTRKYESSNFTLAYGHYLNDEVAFGPMRFSTALAGSPFVVGFALDGFPIYSPYDADGDFHTGLDTCNGKVDGSGNYGYYTTPNFPYVLGCYGPGVPTGSPNSTATSAPFAGSHSVSSDTIHCPAGRYLSTDATYGITGAHLEYGRRCDACPSGRYNSRGGSCTRGKCNGFASPDCEGPCEAGHFCPPGSSSPRQQPCGGPEYYCTEGSSERERVQPGYYSTPLALPREFNRGNGTGIPSREYTDKTFVRTAQTLCDPGYFCTGDDGLRRACSASGSFGRTAGLATSDCTGACPRGSYCIPESNVPILCPAGRYGGTEGLQSPDCSGECEPGFYCPAGSVSPQEVACPAGRYGENSGLTSSACSLDCDGGGVNCVPTVCKEGSFCPTHSTSKTQDACGGPDKFCPRGSSTPTAVGVGHYTIGELSISGQYQAEADEKNRFDEVPCEPGTYCINGVRIACPPGKFASLTLNSNKNCEGDCAAGHYCPLESTSTIQIRCGSPAVFCSIGSFEPQPVTEGWYSIVGAPDTRSDQEICPKGSYCVNGVARLCPAGTYGGTTGLKTKDCSGLCADGFYCPEGSTSRTQIACPAGRYSQDGSNLLCKDCEPGYYCPEASVRPDQFECGGDMVYCPQGTGRPFNVTVGFYSTGGGSATTRSGQERCVNSNLVPPKGAATVGAAMCPSHTRTLSTVVAHRPMESLTAGGASYADVVTHDRSTPQQVDVEYNIDAEDEFRYTPTNIAEYPGNRSPNPQP